jgi:D-beta-D-heptose 7-phosphate kinase/D-beta-D-heptose 1-phosphate adenosyltransferase
MIDRYYYGRVRRLNPEKHSAPLLDVQSSGIECAGGAANVATNLEALGAQVRFASQISGVLVKNRLLDMEEGVIARFDVGVECSPVRLDAIEKKAEGCDAVVVSDYGKGAITNETATLVKSLNLPTFVDTKVRPDRWAQWCDAMFPNAHEYVQHQDDYRQTRLCIVKNAGKGATLYSNGLLSSDHFPPGSKNPFNVTGAGDTVTAVYAAMYMAIGLLESRSVRESLPLSIAMKFAGAAVERPFTAALHPVEVYGGSIPQNVSVLLERIAHQ